MKVIDVKEVVSMIPKNCSFASGLLPAAADPEAPAFVAKASGVAANHRVGDR